MNYIERYKELRPTLDTLGTRLQTLLRDIARSVNIDIHTIESRSKTVESFSEKISRPGKSYNNPLEDITDLCGLRVILYYQEDVERLSKAIRNEFTVDDKKSTDKRSELKNDQFGYISVHLICRVSEKRIDLLEWQSYANFNFEIQIRTVLQHAWASISHALQYKSSADIPSQFSRQLSRLSGLLELSDEQFSDLRKKTANLHSKVSKELANSNLDVAINSVALQQYLESSEVFSKLSRTVSMAGFKNYSSSEIHQISEICAGFRISTLDDLNELLLEFSKNAKNFFKNLAANVTSDGTELRRVTGGNSHWCSVMVVAMLHDRQEYGFILENEIWGQNYLEDVLAAARQTLAAKPAPHHN
ncbi:GTP pyrophosphokinase [Pseudomonas sp. 2835]|uniref:GTP pyrophosphokinase n=1 Tax=Pseudomonas sp. 2835 TaxID=3156451 RepID=UPI003D20B4CB